MTHSTLRELSRLKIRARRGMKELDVVFQHYLQTHYPTASAAEIQWLDELLEMQDPLLFDMILGNRQPKDTGMCAIIKKIRQHNDSITGG